MSARAVLRDVGARLRAHAIPVMPLKGVLLQSELYGSRWSRVMSDVDILVPDHMYERALRVLAADGCWCLRNRDWEAYVRAPGSPFLVDMHRRLLLPSSFGLRTQDVFSRARPDHALFGAEFWLPDPLDMYAHLLGHFVASRTALSDSQRLVDFVAVAQRLEPRACARHLEREGLARVARYVLPAVAAQLHDAFAAAVLQALRADPFGRVLTSGLRRWLPRVPVHARWGMLGTHALGRSLGAGAWGAARRIVSCVR